MKNIDRRGISIKFHIVAGNQLIYGRSNQRAKFQSG